MAYREVRMMDIDQVMRRWLAGEVSEPWRDRQVWIGIQYDGCGVAGRGEAAGHTRAFGSAGGSA